MPRLTSEFFVAQLMRRTSLEGGFAVIVKKGSSEAGAIYIVVRQHAGSIELYGPSAQHNYAHDRPSERYFSVVSNVCSDDAVAAFLLKEERFDPDFWLVELEMDLTKKALPFEVMTQ